MDIKYLDYKSLAALRELVGNHRHKLALEWRKLNEITDDAWEEIKERRLTEINSESPFGVWNRILTQIQETESGAQQALSEVDSTLPRGGAT